MLRPPALVAFAVAVCCAVADAQTDPTPDTRPSDRAQAIAARISTEVETVRGLPFKAPPKIGLYRTDELRAFIIKAFERDLPPAKLAATERSLKALRLLPADYDLGAGLLELLTEQIAGFYDPVTKELRLIDRSGEPEGSSAAIDAMLKGMGMDMDAITMAHELTHALQDQHFPLLRLPLDLEGEDDLAAASQATVEGDATVAMMAWTFSRNGGRFDQIFNPVVGRAAAGSMDLKSLPGGAKLAECPPYLRESLIFPYIAGMTFCLDVARASKSFAPIDAALAAPPRSTEQILHAEKLDGAKRDDPQRLELPDLAPHLPPGYRLLTTNVLGEAGCRVLFADELGARAAAESAPAESRSRTAERRAAQARAKAAAAVAAGWDGDRYAVYVKDGAPDVLVWLSVWDTAEDRAEAAARLIELFGEAAVFACGPADGAATVEADGPTGQDVVLVTPVDAAAGGGAGGAASALPPPLIDAVRRATRTVLRTTPLKEVPK
ncbi:MAG TPA: hypothetical protein VEI02_04220 [Planctomycetota bacterium]|nr:hypothetical protein [Planctomycetota bacterium]